MSLESEDELGCSDEQLVVTQSEKKVSEARSEGAFSHQANENAAQTTGSGTGSDEYGDGDGTGEADGAEFGLEGDDDDEIDERRANIAVETGCRHATEEMSDSFFDELVLVPEAITEMQEQWAIFLKSAESREAAGESIYSALFEAAPSLQGLYKTPRAVQAMRFIESLNQVVVNLHKPHQLKVFVETLSFQHMPFEVSVPRASVFRDTILELVAMELGPKLTPLAAEGFTAVLNYIGGAFIYVRSNYTSRLKILASSWAVANNKASTLAAANANTGDTSETGAEPGLEGVLSNGTSPPAESERPRSSKQGPKVKAGKTANLSTANSKLESQLEGEGVSSKINTVVPTTYPDMFRFNAAVMGFASRAWMNEILASFDTIVQNVANSYRLQEECDVLSLRISKYGGNVVLSEYKAVMLASLRSLIAKEWDSDHEVAWTWLWDNVERMISAIMGKPLQQEKALARLWGSLTESSFLYVRNQIYVYFFQLAPTGMDYFKQSATRLHFIADKVVSMTLEIYKEPARMVEDLSALGLRHVGYGIPTELFGPFVSACVQTVRNLTEDQVAQDAFRWSLNLISRILTRVITEGSTLVMRAINVNSGRQLRKAAACAPRNERAEWMLCVTVGTQSISPLIWAMHAGSFEAAEAILRDLLTIRADRDRYYFGIDRLFERHPDIVRRLGIDAPALLPVLLDGMIWRARTTENGYRRVNYFVKHMLIGEDEEFSPAIGWITDLQDPKLVCHPVAALVMDLVWRRVAYRMFLLGKLWLLLTLCVFVLSQCILYRMQQRAAAGLEEQDLTPRIATLLCRCFIYGCSLFSLLSSNFRRAIIDLRAGDVHYIGRIPVPAYMFEGENAIRVMLTLTLFLMFVTEPILHCLSVGNSDELFGEFCPEGVDLQRFYSILSMLGVFLYFMLLADFSVFSTRVSAFRLVLSRVCSEVFLFFGAFGFVIMTFACGLSALREDLDGFESIPHVALFLLQLTLGMVRDDQFQVLSEYPLILATIVVFLLTTAVFMLNLLIAQLNTAYSTKFQDMLGLARLKRGAIVADCMRRVKPSRWERFVESLNFDRPCEFGEGDVGFPGVIMMVEPASENATTVETIRRYGGTTSPTAIWPDDSREEYNVDERLEKVEKLLKKTLKKIVFKSNGGSAGNSIGDGISGMSGLDDSADS